MTFDSNINKMTTQNNKKEKKKQFVLHLYLYDIHISNVAAEVTILT